VRWLRFTLLFIGIILFSFSLYVWTWRVELVQATVAQACYPYQVSIGSMEIPSSTSLQLHNFELSRDDQKIHIDLVECLSHSWLPWLFIPSSAPLRINSINIYPKTTLIPVFDQPIFPFLVTIDAANIHWPDGSVSTHENLSGPLHEALEKILVKEQKNESEELSALGEN